MLRKFVFGLVAIALIVSVHWVSAAGAADQDVSADDVRAALKQLNILNDRTALSRLNLAKAAIASARNAKDTITQRADYEAARDVLTDAARLEPANKEVAELLSQVNKSMPAAPPPATAPVVPPPATKPGPATKPVEPAVVIKRMVTPAEINRIRQLEWRPDETPRPPMRVDADVRKKFHDSTTDPTPTEFNAMKPDAQAAVILASGKEEFRNGVHIMTDPASIKEFKKSVELVVTQSCAVSGCHTNNKAGRFNLYSEKNDAAAYTNFLILQQYATKIGGAERLMIDRTTPDDSLLLQFLLPPELAPTPHPTVPGFKPPVRSKSEPRYVLVEKWLKALDPIAPKYGIDLTKDPEPADAPKK